MSSDLTYAHPRIELITRDSARIERLKSLASSGKLVDLGDLLGGPVWVIESYEQACDKSDPTSYRAQPAARFIFREIFSVVFTEGVVDRRKPEDLPA